jgi:hypothetical protein
LTFQPRIALIQESCYGETSSVLGHLQLKLHHGEISKTQVPLIVGARAFMRVAKKGTTFAIYAHYKEYQDVFEKKNIDLLPQHRLYDCIIDLQEGTQPPFGPIYNLSQNELVAL